MDGFPERSLLLLSVFASLSAGCTDAGFSARDVAEVRISPAEAVLTAPGDTVRFHATTVASDGSPSGVAIEWTSSDHTVATVGPTGLATGVREGSAIVWASASGARAGAVLAINPDTVPPRLESAVLSASRVAVQNRTGTLKVGIRLTDDRAGVRDALAQFQGPGGSSITGVVGLSLTDGDRLSGLWEGVLSIPANTGVGTWKLGVVRGEDLDGNVGVWREAELEALGLALTFEVVWVR